MIFKPYNLQKIIFYSRKYYTTTNDCFLHTNTTHTQRKEQQKDETMMSNAMKRISFARGLASRCKNVCIFSSPVGYKNAPFRSNFTSTASFLKKTNPGILSVTNQSRCFNTSGKHT